jgi:hypothetical protein
MEGGLELDRKLPQAPLEERWILITSTAFQWSPVIDLTLSASLILNGSTSSPLLFLSCAASSHAFAFAFESVIHNPSCQSHRSADFARNIDVRGRAVSNFPCCQRDDCARTVINIATLDRRT